MRGRWAEVGGLKSLETSKLFSLFHFNLKNEILFLIITAREVIIVRQVSEMFKIKRNALTPQWFNTLIPMIFMLIPTSWNTYNPLFLPLLPSIGANLVKIGHESFYSALQIFKYIHRHFVNSIFWTNFYKQLIKSLHFAYT